MATDPRTVTMPVVGLGTDDDFSLLASACRGHLVGVCLHGVSVDTVALAVVVVVRRLFITTGDPHLLYWVGLWRV